jgi:hypothetical protein
LLVPLLLYAPLVFLAAAGQRDQINDDGIAYLRSALYLAQGRWSDSVSTHWSPLLSWSIAPLLWLGLDSLVAARVVLAVWGAVLICGALVFIRRATSLRFPWDMLLLTLLVPVTIRWATQWITPDLVLGAVLIWYFSLTVQPSILSGRRQQLLAGMVAGLAYLAKAYAFPFFLAHYTATLVLHWLLGDFRTKASHVARAGLVGWLGLCAVGGPWIAVLSLKSGHFTISTAGTFNHYGTGPLDCVDPGVAWRPHAVSPGRVAAWETPETLISADWSPFASRALLVHEVKHIHRNLGEILAVLGDFDMLAIVPGILFLAPVLALYRQGRGGGASCPIVWPVMTVAIYAGGFLPLFFQARYLEAALWPLCCTLTLGVLVDAGRSAAAFPRLRPLAPLALAMLCLVAAFSFAAHPALDVAQSIRRPHATGAQCRELGERLRARGCRGPVAACDAAAHQGLYAAYHASVPFLGVVESPTTAGVEDSLERHGAKFFVVNSKWGLCDNFLRETDWHMVFRSTAADGSVFVFRAPETQRVALKSDTGTLR